jgi:predicted GNAT family acetyltransferase
MPSLRDLVEHQPEAQRYLLELEGQSAVLEYRQIGAVRDLFHTGVPAALGGRGVGSALVEAALRDARLEGWEVRPSCPFVAAYLKRHPEFADLVESAN